MHSDVVIVLCAEEGVACGGEEDETFCRKGGENTGAFSAKAVQTFAPARNKRRTNKSTAVASMMLTHRHMRAITHFWQEMYQTLSVTLCLEWYKSHISEITSNTVSDYHWGPPASVFLWMWQHEHRSVPVKILCNIFSLYFIVETTMTSQTGASSHLHWLVCMYTYYHHQAACYFTLNEESPRLSNNPLYDHQYI